MEKKEKRELLKLSLNDKKKLVNLFNDIDTHNWIFVQFLCSFYYITSWTL